MSTTTQTPITKESLLYAGFRKERLFHSTDIDYVFGEFESRGVMVDFYRDTPTVRLFEYNYGDHPDHIGIQLKNCISIEQIILLIEML
jgi:hypothetical protein